MLSSQQPSLRVLLLEDDASDAELVTHTLRREDVTCTVHVVDNREGFSRALDVFAPDVVLSDHGVSDFPALDALALLQERRPMTALLLVSGTLEENAIASLKAGAADFIRKADLTRLAPAIRTALELRAPLRRLSPRQCAVLQLLAAGSSTRDIAARLQVSVKTIETHRAQVMKRLDIHDVASLVRFAVRVGIVSATR
jgi:DNA-binding NarL/FixJ family response regulator